MMQYNRIVRITDRGPYVTKLILPLPCKAGIGEISPDTFIVYAECRDEDSGKVRVKKDILTGRETPMKGYPPIVDAYPCDENGNRVSRGSFAAIELGDSELNNRIFDELLINTYVDNYYRITQAKPLPGAEDAPDVPVTGSVFDELGEQLCPDLEGWQHGVSSYEACPLRYAFFYPKAQGKIPLVVWLHGAGESGTDLRLVNTGNRVTAISGADIQGKLGGAAAILVPQSPTVWMDDGKEILGRSNESIYVRPLKALIDGFIADHPGIDADRIYIGGPSNGGFMTVRMLREYPGFFAAGAAVCTPWYQENLTEEAVAAIGQTPLWLVHSKADRIVPVYDSALPLYHALKAAGAEVHMTLFDKVTDQTGLYRDDQGRPLEFNGHFVWIPTLNDDVVSDLDGSRVMVGGVPVTLWEWIGKHRKA